MGCGLWADALLLSSHIDAAMWKTVMARYAAEVSVAGSPLATLYSLFAGSGPGVLYSRCRLAARCVVPLLITTLLGCCQVLAPPSGATESPLAARWAENLATLLASRTWRVHGACTTRPRHAP